MEFLNKLTVYNQIINQLIWNKIGLAMLIFTGILAGIALHFFQLIHPGLWWKKTFCTMFKKSSSKSNGKSSISPFQSACTALAATIGVGNLAGVTSAIAIGGPGAIFWMWLAALMGMGIGYLENVLGIYFRRKNLDGQWCGGAMYYLRDGLGCIKGCKKLGKALAALFALFTVLASFGIGSMGQVNKIVINLVSAFPAPGLQGIALYDSVSLYSLLIGICLFLLSAIIIVGGISRIAAFAEKMVPFMIIFFMAGSLAVILKNYQSILPAFGAIFSSAFGAKAGVGGAVGAGFVSGFKRGIFSNEAGMGSSVIIHTSTSVTEPCEQGMWSIFEIFVDTILMCTLTAMVVLCSGVYDIHTGLASSHDATMMASAFNTVFSFGNFGERFIAICILMFAFTSIIGWNHYGSKAWEYLFGGRAVFLYRFLHLGSIIAGALLTSSLAWDISDTFNGLMMLPNLVGVVLLLPLTLKIHKNYIARTLRGKGLFPMISFFSDIQKSRKR